MKMEGLISLHLLDLSVEYQCRRYSDYKHWLGEKGGVLMCQFSQLVSGGRVSCRKSFTMVFSSIGTLKSFNKLKNNDSCKVYYFM